MPDDPRLGPDAYVSGDGELYRVLGVDTVTSEVLLENCRAPFARRRVPVYTMCLPDKPGQPARWQLIKPAPAGDVSNVPAAS